MQCLMISSKSPVFLLQIFSQLFGVVSSLLGLLVLEHLRKPREIDFMFLMCLMLLNEEICVCSSQHFYAWSLAQVGILDKYVL